VPPNYIAATLSDEMGEYEAAVAEAREAVRLAPGTSWPHNNLAQALWGSARFGELKQAIGEATRLGLDDMSAHAYLLGVACMEGDRAGVERETRWGLDRREHALLWRTLRGSQAAEAGRVAEARRWFTEAIDRAGDLDSPPAVASVHLALADLESLLGDPVAGRRHVAAALSVDRSASTLPNAALALTLAGDRAGARALLRELAPLTPTDPARIGVWTATVEAALAAGEGRGDDALRILLPIARFLKGNDFVAVPLYVRGIAAASAGRPKETAEAFGEVVRLRMIAWGPHVPAARLGLARALRDAGDRPGSLAAYDAFLATWKEADRNLPLLKVAERERESVR
jgi:tetratricopeptide (TPR) repeat protein